MVRQGQQEQAAFLALGSHSAQQDRLPDLRHDAANIRAEHRIMCCGHLDSFLK